VQPERSFYPADTGTVNRVLALAATFLLLLVPASPAQTGGDQFSVAEDGTVTLVRVVPIPAPVLLRVLTDPSLASKLAPDVVSKELLKDGPCPIYRVATKGLFRPLVYEFQSCTSATGVTEKLVASEDFDAFFSRWLLTPVEGGTELRYDLLIKTRLKVPHKLVRASQRRSMRATMRRLLEQATVR